MSGGGSPHGDGATSRVDALLAAARAHLVRAEPEDAARSQRAGALLVDIRYASLRERDGTIPGALVVERNELEWRLDPSCPHRAAEATGPERPVVVICNEGYASSLAAHGLQQLGLRNVTDLVGGFQAWRAAGLPVDAPGTSASAPRPAPVPVPETEP